MSQELLTTLVWTYYRVAVVFYVLVPLGLLVWAWAQRARAIFTLLGIYWKVSSLLMITVYLLIGALPIGFPVSFLAQVLLPACLWFWVDINEEIAERPGPLAWATNVWRWIVTWAASLGALAMLPFLRCGFLSSNALVADAQCRVWLEAPWGYREIFHPNVPATDLGFWGVLGLVVYSLMLAYFLLVRLAKQGRTALS
ncbi:MAG: DUF3177 family protein [Gloeomargarita sp. SKYBB_i_bin120]|nr:DUF3177 family protein [Gloeomargarita sp. SKYG98]MCS7293361.1 DUF3177 family protein [Gloeomargarita sp. SKYB120]MDW8178926.1 DUF3177 family protein [Gloeomargarita sp. SKYBB_i_bin120]